MNNIVDSLMELGNVIILWLEDIFSVSKKTEQASNLTTITMFAKAILNRMEV